LKRSDKKLDEDAQRVKNRHKLFLSKALKVLTQWLTWCGEHQWCAEGGWTHCQMRLSEALRHNFSRTPIFLI